MNDRLSARIAQGLMRAGADTLFGLPGGGPNLAVIAAARAAGLRFVLTHSETSAAVMAATYGRLTHRAAPVVVTRGPGAASAVNGVAQATLDRFPLLVLADTVTEAEAHRVGHQRLDQRAMMSAVSKVTATLTNATGPDLIADLIDVAIHWPAGAVYCDIDPDATETAAPRVGLANRGHVDFDEPPDEETLDAARTLIGRSRRPLVIAGFEAAVHGQAATDALHRFGCPVLTTYQAIGIVPTEGSLHAGLFTNACIERPAINACDLVITVGLDEVEPLNRPWTFDKPVLRLSTVAQATDYYTPTVDVVAPFDQLVDLLSPRSTNWPGGGARTMREAARDQLCNPPGGRRGFGPLALVETAAACVPTDATVTLDAGAHFLATMPLWPVTEPLRVLISNGLATMGFSLPAAIGAALARPGQPVLAFTGDGGLALVMAELETLVRLGLPVTVVVFNDAALSLIDAKQLAGAEHEAAVHYRPIDFAAVARAVGLRASVVTSAADFAAVLGEPTSSGWKQPRLIDARIDAGDYRHIIEISRGNSA